MQLLGLAAATAAALSLPVPTAAIRAVGGRSSPVASIVGLLGDLKTRIQADGQTEQRAYDKYACWCEDTLVSKAAEITASKDQIESVQSTIIQLKGDLGAHGAEIKQLKKDIEANLESQREATEMRAKEKSGYGEEKAETEQCIGALEAAITALSGVGAGGKKGFLETLQEAQLLSVVAGVKGVLAQPVVSRTVGEKDLEVVRRFVERPEDFVGGRAGMLSAAQIANNPFGDYAPQSTQIQGILKSMYESFARDLEKANGEEAEKQKGFEELMATKRAELVTLQGTLQKHEGDEADKTKRVADGRVTLDDTKAQLEADEAFFADTKSTCETKAAELAQRTRLRTEELNGIARAIAILSSPEATKTFANASTTLLQVSAGVLDGTEDESREKAYQKMRSLATRYGSVAIARIASQVRTGSAGHFDEVIAQIDKMIELLRKEEQEDIEQRDWCQGKEGKNKNDMADLNYDIDKATKTVDRLKTEAADLQTKLGAIEGDINATQASMTQLIQLRSQEHADFVQAVKDDSDAMSILNQAIATLSKFYTANGISLALSQSQAVGAIKPRPDTPFESGAYGGRKGESVGIIAILKMVRDDYEKEMQTGRAADGEAQASFERDRQAMQDTLDAYRDSKANTEKELADLQAKITDIEQYKSDKGQDLDEEKKMEQALQGDCGWVQTHFQSRRDKRKAEVDGLVEAKNFLAGVDDGI